MSTHKLRSFSITGSLSDSESLILQARQVLYTNGLVPTEETYIPRSAWFQLFNEEDFIAWPFLVSEMGIPLELLPAVQLSDGSIAAYLSGVPTGMTQSTDGTTQVEITFTEDETPTTPFPTQKGTRLN